MELTPEQSDRIRRLLMEELRAALRAAHPEDLAALVADRRAALAALLQAADDEPEPRSP